MIVPRETRPAKWTLRRWFAGTTAVRSMIEQSLRRDAGVAGQHLRCGQDRSSWTDASCDLGNHYAPLGVKGSIARALQNMQSLADLLAARKIPLTLAVYPWPLQVVQGNPDDNRQVTIWRDFCARNCKAFINLFPAFAAEAKKDAGWYERLFIVGDVHYSLEGNRLMFRELAKHLLSDRSDHAKTGQAP